MSKAKRKGRLAAVYLIQNKAGATLHSHTSRKQAELHLALLRNKHPRTLYTLKTLD